MLSLPRNRNYELSLVTVGVKIACYSVPVAADAAASYFVTAAPNVFHCGLRCFLFIEELFPQQELGQLSSKQHTAVFFGKSFVKVGCCFCSLQQTPLTLESLERFAETPSQMSMQMVLEAVADAISQLILFSVEAEEVTYLACTSC
jgi:hypothetical protein